MDDDKPKRTRINQTDVPAYPLVEALRVADAIAGEFARQPVKPLRLAQALDMKPSSSRFRTLTGAAFAYGLTTAAYNSAEIGLTELGKRCVAPTYDGQDTAARKEAFMKPRIISKVLRTYNGTKFPSDKIGINVLVDIGIAAERAPAVLELIRSGARTLGLTNEIKGELYVDIDKPARSTPSEPGVAEGPDHATHAIPDHATALAAPPAGKPVSTRVFIGQGGSDQISAQLKELLVFGKFEPVMSEPDRPVSLPAIAEMQSCVAAVLPIGQVTDEPALIRIGAAIALYGERTILLVADGAELPAGLPDLHTVRYDGGTLDVTATMTLLKAFNDISAA